MIYPWLGNIRALKFKNKDNLKMSKPYCAANIWHKWSGTQRKLQAPTKECATILKCPGMFPKKGEQLWHRQSTLQCE
jgi:hypothetical protein